MKSLKEILTELREKIYKVGSWSDTEKNAYCYALQDIETRQESEFRQEIARLEKELKTCRYSYCSDHSEVKGKIALLKQALGEKD